MFNLFTIFFYIYFVYKRLNYAEASWFFSLKVILKPIYLFKKMVIDDFLKAVLIEPQ